MQTDEFLKLVRSRRSCRRFKAGPPVPDEYIDKMMEAARWAMSGANGQPWEFIVVKDPKTIKKMSAIHIEQSKEGHAIEQSRALEYRQQTYTFGPKSPSPLDNASAVIVVVGDRRTVQATVIRAWVVPMEGGTGSHYYKNMANATQNMMLAAATMGIGARWVSIAQTAERQLKRLLDVPDALDIHTLVPVGHFAYKPPPPYRRKLAEIVHREKYDTARFRTMDKILEFLADLRKRSTAAYYVGHENK